MVVNDCFISRKITLFSENKTVILLKNVLFMKIQVSSENLLKFIRFKYVIIVSRNTEAS